MCNKLYQLKILYKYDACFSLNNQKEKMLTEPGVAMRTCAKYEFECRLGSGAEALQGASPPLGK